MAKILCLPFVTLYVWLSQPYKICKRVLMSWCFFSLKLSKSPFKFVLNVDQWFSFILSHPMIIRSQPAIFIYYILQFSHSCFRSFELKLSAFPFTVAKSSGLRIRSNQTFENWCVRKQEWRWKYRNSLNNKAINEIRGW